MDRADALRKIKACLRLAASSNPNEAAAALRQAQALMSSHQISHLDALDVDDAEVNTRCRGAMPAQSLVALLATVSDGIGVQSIMIRSIVPGGGGRTVFRFYGTNGSAEVAAYAFTVLRRQLDKDRLKHIARVRKRGNREARGEVFALHWVSAIARLFPKATVPESAQLAIDTVFRARHPNCGTSDGRDLTARGKTRDDDAWAGRAAGLQAKLHGGLKGHGQKRLDA